VGRPHASVELAVRDGDDRDVRPGEVGEVCLRSPAQMSEYWCDPEQTRAAFTADGFVRTGDIGYIDEDGYLFIVDRKKDIIIRGGENISAAEVEAALYGCEGIAEAAVFGAPDDRLGEVPVAILHRCEGSIISEEDLRSFLEGRLSAYKIPARMIFSDLPLPRLGTGKIDRIALKQQYAG